MRRKRVSRYRCKTFLPGDLSDRLSGPFKKLGHNWYAKKQNGRIKLFYLLGSNLYREMSRACFDTTMQNSKHIPTEAIKENLKTFEVENA